METLAKEELGQTGYKENFYAVIGLGGAGAAISSQLVTRLHKEGVENVKLFLFNTSSIDMKGMQAPNYYLLGEPVAGADGKKLYEGCGKSREKGREIALSEEENLVKIFQELKDNSNITAVIMNFSSGGGTGSGMSVVFAKVLKQVFGKDLPVIVNMIKPFDYESIPNVNAINNLMEFSSILARKDIVFNLIDNNVMSERTNSTNFADINKLIVDSQLLFFYDYLERNSKPSSSFSLDRNDMYRIVSQRSGTGGLISIYGFKTGKGFKHIFNLAGTENNSFEGARKVLCIVRDSKHIKEAQKAIKSAGTSNVTEYKSIEFNNSVVGNESFDALVYAIGEPKTDNIVEDMLEKFNEAQEMKTSLAEKDSIKSSIKEKGMKKVRLKF